MEDERRAQCSTKRKRKQCITDASAKFGPLEHFSHPGERESDDDNLLTQRRLKKVQMRVGTDETLKFSILIESGTRDGYQVSTFKRIVQFYDNDETTEVSFPNKEVRLCQ